MSTAHAHTPGPWKAAAKPSSVVGWPVVSAIGRSICSVAYGESGFNGQAEANAKLIAASPDLYSALQRLSATYDGIYAQVSDDEAKLLKDAWAEADAALAKVAPSP
jgi:hypothetical protein